MTDKWNTLVVDQHAIHALASALLETAWFSNFLLPPTAKGLRRVPVDNSIYILSDRADEKSRLLVMRIGEDGVFAQVPSPRHLLDRILHLALTVFEKTVSIPVTWRSYHEGSQISVYAQPESKAARQRLHIDRAPRASSHIYAHTVTTEVEDFSNVDAHLNFFDKALKNYIEALVKTPPAVLDAQSFGIVLTEPLGLSLIGSGTLQEWYERKLTREQRHFVDRDHSAPVRLKGPAGTGKTLSMAVKCLRDLYRYEENGKNARVAFITHSAALAHEVLPGMLFGLDPSGLWTELRHSSLWTGSLYELAQDILQYEGKDLKPLSLDGREGREWQRLLIVDAIKACLSSSHFSTVMLPACSLKVLQALKYPDQHEAFISELMNEFACVIDAENIRKGNEAAERYVHAPREHWQMSLPTEIDRQAVLEIHDRYGAELEASRQLSMDQMIADFNRYLTTHEWRQLRDRSGYDVIFVDEFHYFNRSESMIFHNLFRSTAGIGGRLPLFMAYDLKQSPNDAGFFSKTPPRPNIFRNVRAGESELIVLTDVFRYTPEIAAFLKDLDGAFPALNLEGEWGKYDGAAQTAAGEVPKLTIFAKDLELLDAVFYDAARAARQQGGRQVAVLCMNEKLFGIYLNAGRIVDKFVAISGRDEVQELRYARTRCVFSMPEYVAGLQFHTVFLIHVDRADTAGDHETIGARRRFVSRCYLGASRATSRLEIAASAGRGGPSDVLEGPLRSKSLERVDKTA